MKAIGNFFKSINAGLNRSVDYFDDRVRTGKFVDDIINICKRICLFLWKIVTTIFFFLVKSQILDIIKNIFSPIWRLLLKVHILENTFSLFADTVKILFRYYAEIFIVFALTFPTSILLLNLFETAIVTFFVALIPILIWNTFIVSALYYCITKRDEGEHISLWHSTLVILKRFHVFSYPTAIHAAIAIEGIVSFLIFAITVKYLFSFINLDSSFIYLFLVTPLGFLILSFLLVFTIIMHQTYFAVLLDNMTFQQALRAGKKYVTSHLSNYLFFYLLFYLYCALFIARAALAYLYLGLIVSSFFAVAIGVFLGFLLRRNFSNQTPLQDLSPIKRTSSHMIFSIILFFGLINYVLASYVVSKNYQPLLLFIQKQQDNYLASLDVKSYSNDTYHYSLEYPKNWSVYQWNTDTVSFYNNYTGTVSGGTWLTIRVSRYKDLAFMSLYQANPGVYMYDSHSKDVTTKISNFIHEGNEGINYTYVKSGTPYTQYETHYLIHKGSYVYDIVFASVTNDIEGYNSELFNKIVNSFHFSQTK